MCPVRSRKECDLRGRLVRLLAVSAAFSLVLAACAETKDTGFNNLPKAKGKGGGGGAGATVIAMKAGNIFDPATFKAKVSEKVIWRNDDTSGQPHNVVADDGSFDSNPGCTLADAAKCLDEHATYSHTFDKAGTYGYYCVVHGARGGVGMAGTIEVT